MNSSTKSLFDCKEKTDEESGWTSYLQDYFSLNNNSSSDNYGGGGSAYSYRYGGPSLKSDAASPVAWKERGGANDHGGGHNVACSSMGGFKRLKNLNKSKKKISDPDLEDTASSPLNSPKVTVLKLQAEINQKKIKENNLGNYSNRII